MKYNVLLLGSGGREHALAWKIAQSESLGDFYALPGNPGIAQHARLVGGNVKDFELIKETVIEKGIDIVVVGPEDPLVGGLKDYLMEDERLVGKLLFVGPGRDGAELEGSKDFAKEFMTRHGIPTAAYQTFTGEEKDAAKAFLGTLKAPYVLKADGLAAGKGVLICESLEEAYAALDEILGGKFGSAGDKVVIEEFLSGIEVSFFALTDGKDYLLLPEAKDYKRIMDGDQGLNTGGMGAVSPVPFADAEFIGKVEERIIRPTVDGLRKEGVDYRGFIFFGLMNCAGDPYVIEYNVRMGDPETEAVMMRIESDFLRHLAAAAEGRVAEEKIVIAPQTAMTCIMVSGGYPGDYPKGFPITIPSDLEGLTVFNAGTALKDGQLVTAGGRVLAVTAKGACVHCTIAAIYGSIDRIRFDGAFYRKDIGKDIIKWM